MGTGRGRARQESSGPDGLPRQGAGGTGEHEALHALWAVPAPTVVTGLSGRVRFANAAALDLMGVDTPASLEGSILDWTLPDDREMLSRRLLAAALDGAPVGDLLVRVQGRERVVPCLVGGSEAPEEWAAARIVWVLVRPGVWAAEQGPVDVATLSAALGMLASTRCGGPSGSRRMEQAVRWWRACTGEGSEVHLWVRRWGQDVHVGTSQRVRDWGAAQLERGEGPVVTAWRDETTVRSLDVGQDPRFPSLASTSSGRSAVSCPVTCDGLVGVVTVLDPDEHLLDEDALVLSSLATAASRPT